ncbi:MAG: BtpA/SgcQ family protein [Candidatus Obscuribacterales bacterium]|nr:BtpA/SgcQ family protein [Candidatus Obscuribacterales bacterium]
MTSVDLVLRPTKEIMLLDLFGTETPVIGVIHLLPLPGSPRWDGQFENVCLRAEQEAAALATGGANGIIVENFFDAPFSKNQVDTATACAMSIVINRIMAICDLPIGVNVLRNDALTAMAVAATTGAQFIRVNVLTGAMVTDQGLIEGQAHELHLYRRHLDAHKNVRIFADVMVKHASPLGAINDIKLIAKDTVKRGLADAVIVSGSATGDEPSLQDLENVRDALPNTPIFVGSGASKKNVKSLLRYADGVIVASSLKRQGILENPVDVEQVRALINIVKEHQTAQEDLKASAGEKL